MRRSASTQSQMIRVRRDQDSTRGARKGEECGVGDAELRGLGRG